MHSLVDFAYMMRACTPDLSIIIPVLNEAPVLASLFSVLESQLGVSVEVVFSDGGSSDTSMAMIGAYALRSKHRVSCVSSLPGRGRQMNSGANLASSALLLFLHADSHWESTDLLRGAVEHYYVCQCACPSTTVAGHFSLTFAAPDRSAIFYDYLAEKSMLNRRGTIYGDQGMLVPRKLWQSVGGFREDVSVLEDVLFAQAVFAVGKWILLPQVITTSSRRYAESGVVPTLISNAVLVLAGGADLFCLPPRPGAGFCHSGAHKGEFAQLLVQVNASLIGLPWSEYFTFWYKSGQTTIEFAWLPCYAASCLIPWLPRRQRLAILCWYDRWVLPVIARPVVYGLVAICAWLVFYVFYLCGVYSGGEVSRKNTAF
jgi:hypothetical protein